MLLTRRAIIVIVAALLLLGGGITVLRATHLGPASDIYHGCVDARGNVRIIGDQQTGQFDTECKKNDTQIDLASGEGFEALSWELDELVDGFVDLEQRVADLETTHPPTPPTTATPTPEANLEQQVLAILGPTGVILPLVDTSAGITFTTLGAIQATFTWSEAVSAFDIPPGIQCSVPIVTFNGLDEHATTPDAAAWSVDDSGDAGFSVGAWVHVVGGAYAAIFTKWHNTTPLREYRFIVEDGNKLNLTIGEESATAFPKRVPDVAIPLNQWIYVVVTYDGTGGATAANGLTFYVNGIAVASTATNKAGYVAMENSITTPILGDLANGGMLWNGMIAGGPLGPWFATHNAAGTPTAAQIEQLYELGKAALCLS